MKKLVLLAVAMVSFSGCAGFAFSSRGTTMAAIYNDTKANEKVTENVLGTKQGEACASSILGLVTTGDASVPEAAKKAGITKVASVDHSFSNILGIVATYCVIATGE
jgi:hypothetical protein